MAEEITPSIRFTWNISYDCNYRCSYCFFEGRWEEYKKRNIYLSVADWLKYWERIFQKYGRLFLIITGGEPFLYPDFTELIKQLSEYCFHINISTNASVDLKSFVEEMNPERVSVSLSFQREFSCLEDYIGKVKLLRKYHFNGCLNLVAYPPFIEKIAGDSIKLKEETGEEFKIIPFFGRYQDIEYPQGYTEKESQILGIEDSWFNKVKRKGSMCSAGFTSALIFPDGKVARCGQIGERVLLGSFFEPGFKLYDQPILCDAEYCPCQEDSIDGSADEARKVNLPVKNVDKSKEDLLQINRKLSCPDGKISFAWDIHYRCNFRCPYCWFFDNWAQQASRNLYLSPQEWLKQWQRIFEKYGEVRIAITGGEPFIYPRFIELVRELSNIHIIKITTNMSGDIEAFVKEISPRRVYLDLNFHPLFTRSLDEFIRKTKLLHAAGFDAGVCYLAYPPQLNRLNFYKQHFEENKIRFALAAFWGSYNNKKYPDSYTPQEKELIKPFLGDVDRMTYHLDSASPKGKLCNAGYKYANIQGDGKVVRCAQYAQQPFGSILDDDFYLFDRALPCENDLCPGNEYGNLVD